MKIGFFTDSYLPMRNGVVTSVEDCAKALEARGHEVYIIAPDHPRYKNNKANVYPLPSVKLFAPEYRMALPIPEKVLLNILQIDFDIIHGHAGGSVSLLGREIARYRNIPYVFTYHTFWNKYTHYIFEGKIVRPKTMEIASRLFGNICDFIIAPTQRVKKDLLFYGVTRPIHVLPSGIILEKYRDVPKGFLRKKLNIDEKKKILLYVGRLGKEKSLSFLIESFKIIHRQDPQTVFVLVGTGTERKGLKDLVAELQLEESVYFMGSVSHANIQKTYADASIFLFASQTETQGLVILEALASGIPVVTIKDEAFTNVMQDGKNGYMVKNDPAEFAKKVVTLLKDEALRNQLSEGALQSVAKFSIQTTAQYLEGLYKKLIEKKNKNSKRKKIRDVTVGQFKKYFLQAREQLRNYLEVS